MGTTGNLSVDLHKRRHAFLDHDGENPDKGKETIISPNLNKVFYDTNFSDG